MPFWTLLQRNGPVHQPAGLLGVDQAHVDLARGLERAAHGLAGDLVELDPLRLAQPQHLREVPCDRLSLAIGVGGEDDLALALHRLLEIADRLLPALDDLVSGLEALLDVHGQLALGEVPDVAHRGAHVEAVPQEPLERSRLRGRLDDDQTFCHSETPTPCQLSSFRGRAL